MNENKTEKNETVCGIESAAGILRTVQHVLRDTAENRDALPPGSAGSMGVMLCVAMDLLPCSAQSSLKTSIGDVAHILGAAFIEKTSVPPIVSAALADIIRHAVERKPAETAKTKSDDGRRFICRITPGPDLTAAGIESVELWQNTAGGPKPAPERHAKAVAASKGLKGEVAEIIDIMGRGPLNDADRKAVRDRIVDLIRRHAALKKEVDDIEKDRREAAFLAEVGKNEKDRDARAAEKGLRVPDWRDTASGSTQEPKDKPAKPGPKPEPEPQKKGARHFAILNDEGKPAVGVPDDKGKPAEATVAGYYTPEEAENLIARIREWFSACKREHDLSDLATTIEKVFKLSDGQLGEILGVSSRLVCHVRHGRPSPFAKARFAELFGVDGGAK